MTEIGLSTSIWNNNIRSFLLLALYPFMIMAMVWGIAYVLGMSQTGSYIQITEGGYAAGQMNPVLYANNLLLEYWPAILGVIAIWFLISFFFNTAMIRALSHAKPVGRAQEPELYNLLENLCIARGMAMPKINIIETDALNAFASGINQSSYTITVTRGLMQALQKDEMEAVLGHELTHIINRDVRLLIVTVIFTGMIGFAAQVMWSQIRHGMIYRGGSNRGRGNGMLVMLAIAAILWVGYMATLFTRFAISRRREYMADAGSIELTKNPDAMMRALMRISGKDRIQGVPEDVAMMCIENAHPFLGLFATHPPIDARIRAIAEITHTPVPEIRAATPSNPWLRH